jgi:hypothetical protein
LAVTTGTVEVSQLLLLMLYNVPLAAPMASAAVAPELESSFQ